MYSNQIISMADALFQLLVSLSRLEYKQDFVLIREQYGSRAKKLHPKMKQSPLSISLGDHNFSGRNEALIYRSYRY
jgi:hypothetical protein